MGFNGSRNRTETDCNSIRALTVVGPVISQMEREEGSEKFL